MTASVSQSAVAFATTGLVMPSIPANTTIRGHCALIWQAVTTAANGPAFGLVTSAAPTDLYVVAKSLSLAVAVKTTTITTAATTAVTATLAGSVAATDYATDLDFTLITGANPVQITVDYEATTAAKTVQVQPGSYCNWLP